MRITGTFIDEITHDIPSQNWGADDWAREFDLMKRIGIDTVILIRAGYRECATFESRTLRAHRPMLPVRENLAEMFLNLAAANEIKLIWGLYDPGDWDADPAAALAVNRDFVREVKERFADHPAFSGWYLTFELSRNEPAQVELVHAAAQTVKALTPELPTVISPYMAGPKAPPGQASVSKEQHERDWRAIFARLSGAVDVVAFQDGHVDYLDLPEYLATNVRLAREAGIACWSNVESFDRDMPIKFPPIDWRKLQYKMDVAREEGMDKLITFEFSHFMSPHSTYPAARNLFRRYAAHFGIDVDSAPMGGA